MTDIITSTPITVRHFSLPRVTLPKFRIGAELVSLITLVAEAKVQAYLAPYQGSSSRKSVDLSPEEQGRDPSW